MRERLGWPYQAETGEKQVNTLITLGRNKIDIVALFESVVGQEPQNARSVRGLLEGVSGGYQPTTADALDAIQKARRFFDIDWDTTQGGYKFVKRFSGHPVVFQNTFSPTAREVVDPSQASEFQANNPEWRRLTQEQTDKFFT